MSTEMMSVPAPNALASPSMNREQVELLKRTVCKGASDDEFKMFLEICQRRKVDPFSKMLYLVPRWDSKLRREVMAVQSSIDYFRLTAGRSDKYAGQAGPQWCGEDEVWKDVWLSKDPPRAARVGVMCKDFKEPLWAVALWDSYVQRTKEGAPSKFWKDMGSLMLGKCAEALAIRRAFPEDLSGLYTQEEMAQAQEAREVEHVEVASEPPKAPTPKTLSQAAERAQAPREVKAEPVAPTQQRPAQTAKDGPDFEALPEYHPDESVTVFKAIRVPKDVIGLWGRWKSDKAMNKPGSSSSLNDRTWLEVTQGSAGGKREQALKWVVERAHTDSKGGVAVPKAAQRWNEKAAWALHTMYSERLEMENNAHREDNQRSDGPYPYAEGSPDLFNGDEHGLPNGGRDYDPLDLT